MFKNISAILLLSLFSASTIADQDIKKGKALLTEHCYGCHGEDVYVREKRIVNSYPKLVQRVRFCSIQRNLTWFEEDIENVAAFLNSEFYHFEK